MLRNLAMAGLLFVFGAALVADIAPGRTILVSRAPDGTPGTSGSTKPSISADGRFVVFNSYATNFVSAAQTYLFRKDLSTGRVSRACWAMDGSGFEVWAGTISGNGRFVAYLSQLDDIVPGDSNTSSDVFVTDLATMTTRLASIDFYGLQGHGYCGGYPSFSEDGRFLAFSTSSPSFVPGKIESYDDVVVKDLVTEALIPASIRADGVLGDKPSFDPVISPDGRFVAFQSYATNLVAGDTNYKKDVFVKDLLTGEIRVASTAADGTFGNDHSGLGSGMPDLSISADGRYVALMSAASNLVPDDTNDDYDLFVKDLQTGQISRPNTAPDGTQGNGLAFAPSLSADGRYIAFISLASNLVPNDSNQAPDAFVRDLQTGAIIRVSVNSHGKQASADMWLDMTDDGSIVVFDSYASNLAPGDTNGCEDVFAHATGLAGIRTTAKVACGDPYIGKRIQITAKLTDKATGLPIAGKPVQIEFGWLNLGDPVVTDANGITSLLAVVPETTRVGLLTLRVTFWGDESHGYSSGYKTIHVQKGPVRLSAPNKTGVANERVILRASLLNFTRQPLAGRDLGFTLNGKDLGASRTNEKGVATMWCMAPNGQPGRTFPIVVQFAGDDQHASASASATLTLK